MALWNATIKGGFWETNGVGSTQGTTSQSWGRNRVALILSRKEMLALREIWYQLTGAAPGAVATKSYTQVSASQELGGARAIETVMLVNRATTAADAGEIKEDMLRHSTRTTFGANPPINLDRNPLGTR